MSEIIKEIEQAQLKAEVPAFNVGDTVRVHGKIKEGNRERIQVFEGTVLKIQGGSNRQTFTVRKFSNGVGVEKTWPMHSPNVEKVEVVREGTRVYVSNDGTEYLASLQNTCFECHSNYEDFCLKCHTYSNVNPTCWDCHVEPTVVGGAN